MVDSIGFELREILELAGKGMAAEAMERCQSQIDALEVKDAPPYIFTMGMIAYYNGDEGLALQLLERAHLIDPMCRNYVEALANIHTRLGHLADGLYYAKLATASIPNPALDSLTPVEMTSYKESLGTVGVSQHNMNAHTYFQLGRFEDAITQAEQELRINPYSVDTMDILARAQLAAGYPDRATAIMQAAIHVTPIDPNLHARMAEALVAAGRHDDALVHQQMALALGDNSDDDDNDARFAIVAGAALNQSDANWLTARDHAARFNAHWEVPYRACPANNAHMGMTGILWDQCHDGPLMDFVQPTVAHINNTILYNTTIRKDIATEQMRSSVYRPRSSIGVDWATLGRIMVGDGLTCLINLCSARPTSTFPTFKGDYRPVTVHWINLPMTDRLPGASVVIAGPQTEDLDERNYGADNVVRLDKLVAYEFPKSFAAEETVFGPPRDVLGYVTFGLTGDPARLTADTVQAVVRTMWSCRESRLLIGGTVQWEDSLVERLTGTFARFGLANRIRFQQPLDVAGNPEPLFYQQIDILLDTTPTSGHRDVARALWMGVPVVSLRGTRRAGRFGASILDAAGRKDWIAGSVDEYVMIASRLAQETDLASLRQGLRDHVCASPLADTTDMAHQLAERLGDWLKRRGNWPS